MAYTLAGVSLGIVTSEKPDKNEVMDEMPVPLSDSSDAWIMSNTGAVMKWTVEGYITDTTVNNLKTKVQALAALINGNQQTTMQYVSNMWDTKSVKASNFRGRYSDKDGPLAFWYEFKIIEASTVI